MARPVVLFTGPFADLALDDLAARAAEWGYAGLELASWGDHLEVQRALGEPDYATARLDLLARHDLHVPVVAAHRVGQAVCDDPIDARHRGLVPDYVWGDGDPEGVRARALEELVATVRVAQRLGAGVVSGFAGSPIWSYVAGWPRPTAGVIAEGLRQFARRLGPLVEVCRETGVRFALEVHPGQVAFDAHSTAAALEALGGREEIGLTFDPSHLHWQGVDPVAFVREFGPHIYHVHVKDAALTLDGFTGVLGGYAGPGEAGRGWDFRSPGHGGIDWPTVMRALNEVGYAGALSVDWNDPGLDRDFGASDACQFVKRIDLPGRVR
jgi:sugar phosphate isomerase/epimerase